MSAFHWWSFAGQKKPKEPQKDKQNPNKKQPSENFKNDHINWIKPPIYLFV